MKDYGKVRSFRIDKHNEKLLNECLETLHITGDSFNVRMNSFIMKVHTQLKEVKELRRKLETKQKKPQPKPEKSTHEKVLEDFEKWKKNNVEPEVPKTGIVTPTQVKQKADISMETVLESDLVPCPDLEPTDWVRKSVECKKCGEDDFKKFSDCYKERAKHPFSELFKCSKPKPS